MDKVSIICEIFVYANMERLFIFREFSAESGKLAALHVQCIALLASLDIDLSFRVI